MKRIYIVEDDDTYARFLKKSIEKNKKYHVETFRSAEDCLQELESKINPQVLIIDYFLPGMTGKDFSRKIRKTYRNIKQIILSSNTDGGLVVDLVKDGVRHYVVKDENVLDSLEAIFAEDDDQLINLNSGN